MKNKAILFSAIVALIVVGGVFAGMQAQSGPQKLVVYKTPTCGCCAKWVDHMEAAGFEVEVHDQNDLSAIKANNGVRREFSSCHTAFVDGYVVEGHVPAVYVQKLLKDRPEVAGLTVPGMPMGSPGMEGSYSEPYDVLTFDRAGQTTVFAHVK